MSLRLEQVVVDSRDQRRLALWWADALGWEVSPESDEDETELIPPGDATAHLLFLNVPESKTLKNRLHLDFVPDDQAAEVDRLIGMGAERVDVGQGEQTWVVLADPEGNEFCVLSARH